MKLRDFLISWRLLVAEPAYSAIVVLGLSIGFSVCILLVGFVRHSFSYDDQVPLNASVYTVYSRFNLPGHSEKWHDGTALAARAAVARSGLADLASGVYQLPVSIRVGEAVHPLTLTAVEPEFAALMGIRAADGDLAASLARPDALALTVEAAQKIFGRGRALGQAVEIAGRAYRVVALLDNPPAATNLPYTALVGMGTAAWPDEDRQAALSKWQAIEARVYVRLKAGVAPAALQGALQRAVDDSPVRAAFPAALLQQLGDKRLLEMRVGRLSESYLDPDLLSTISPLHGDRRVVMGLAAVAVLIMLLAATNYVNLATVRTLRRRREIALRKVMGASGRAIVWQFLVESMLVSLFAVGLGLLIATLLLPAFAELLDRRLDDVLTPGSYAGFGLLGLLIGAAAGAYPAWVALRVDVRQALAGRGDTETNGGLWLRRGLTILQFSTAMVLTGMALTISWQTRYASEAFPGFNPAPLLVVDLPKGTDEDLGRAYLEEATHLPGASGVTAATGAIGRPDWKTFAIVQRADGAPTSVEFKGVANNFFAVHQVAPLAGRLFDAAVDPREQAGVVVMNVAATQALGYATPQAALGTFLNPPVRGSNLARLSGQLTRARALQIVGIAPDIRYQNLREPTPALMYIITPLTKVLTVRASGDPDAVQGALEQLWRRNFPSDVAKIARAASFFERNYADDLRLASLLSAAAGIAIAIAAFGIYVLAAYNTQRRAREIVLRKLYGAGQVTIAGLMAREFMALVAVAAAIGLPLVMLGREHFLATFMERAPVGQSALAYALAMAVAVALLATARHTLIAMRAAPAAVLRY